MRKVVVSGSSGLIGTELCRALEGRGVDVLRLVRRPARGPGEYHWHPGTAELDPAVLADAEAVVNLSGASIGRVPWTRSYRRELVQSRVQPVRALVRALAALGEGAPHLVSASAVGYYGDRPAEYLPESAGPGRTFLAGLCQRWEAEANVLRTGVSLLRTAPVLHPQALLKPLVPLARFGLLGPLGSGEQHWPWISLPDEVAAILHILDRRLLGPVNLAGPSSPTANQLCRALAHRLHRPFALPAPAWALRAVLGSEAADGLLLPDAHVLPAVLLETGFKFTHPTAQAAMDSVLNR
ncbi:TIGR01777 family oxidoreductase [Brevibacterium sp. 50QC2O2]|uniref:TIGR01777 family oxidoreductase n=1 Tax=Brevibacterium TaxID=1696 RepID=UPI00211C44C2|nr:MULTISPECIES: TIGR01777 family oxidoreductase [unclassified Brevibacterium]MCQ9369505.1 TIGR01777 family oxidoreductase [Brevibacterium sp. 91QC2O2]MCQ9386695.1 TIGR01777 family oxidoreductase [Brevibacterium sp. 68QC2CO]MCQ9389351.1 TIGR01777 family oxidoreductase [Brevibacterium sp. 50QC2O2]